MQAIVYKGVGKPMELVDIEKPEPKEGELLLRVNACGICGSDIHAIQTGFVPPGIIMGHEFSGEIVSIGPGVDKNWQIGDRIVSLGGLICGKCDACLKGILVGCSDMKMIGLHPEANGAFAEYVKVQASLSIKVPENVSMTDAAAVEPLAVGLKAFKDGNVPIGEDVLVIGAGAIGISCIKWSRFFGVGNIGVSELINTRCERAKKAGANIVIPADRQDNPVAAFKEMTGRNPTVIFECVGKPIVQHLFEIAPALSHIVLVGASMVPEEIVVATGTVKNLRLTLSLGYGLDDFKFIVQMLAEGRIRTEPLITDIIRLEEVPSMFEILQKPNEQCKAIIQL